MQDIQYRHERKFIISAFQSRLLQERLKYIMVADAHVDNGSSYQLNSLYFDDIDNSCYYDNENGVNVRKKYRIRYYNQDTSLIHLECKHKENKMTFKESVTISSEQALKLISNQEIPIEPNGGLLNAFLLARKQGQLRPVVITQYERTPLVYPLGNVRITFDQKLSSSVDIDNFFSGQTSSRPVFPIGTSLLEVKYDNFLPDYIQDALEIKSLQETAFSKFYYCRRINMRGQNEYV